MRNRAGKLVIDLNKGKNYATASVDYPVVPSLPQVVQDDEFVNENETTYALFPYELNDPPIFTKSIYAASTPPSLHIDSYSPSLAGKMLFHDSEGVVRVLAGSDIVLRVEATQPNVLNVENGVPTLIQKTDRLEYNWSINGASLFEEESLGLLVNLDDTPQVENQVEVNENELVLRNVTDELNGTYICTVSNDIGEISSEAIELQVVHVNKSDNVYFRQNLVKNGFARDSTNEWTAIQGSIAVQPFALREAESELKKPSTPLRQHSVNEIYPHPISIGMNGIKGYDISTLATETSFYFTKTPYAKYADGGRPQSIVYQDIDVSEIQDLIAGRVFGCQGVRAYFGCVMGNSIEYRAMDVLAKSNPNDPKYFYQGAPRLSFENAILTGLPRYSGEHAYVIIQEFEGNTQLSSRRYISESEKARRVDNVVISDPFVAARDSNASTYKEKIYRPSYLDAYKAVWEGGSPSAPIYTDQHIQNPQNPPDVGQDWYSSELYTFSPYNEGTTTLQGYLKPVFWPPDTVRETYGSQLEWIGADPTRILNMYDKVFYNHLDSDYKKASYYSYGQYAEYKDAVITALNPRTTKIRISIVIDSWYDGNDESNYPTLYGEWDRPQSKHDSGYGDPLLAFPTWNTPVYVGVRKSQKILWQTILDNRHLEKMRALPISEDATYRSKLQARQDVVKSYIPALTSAISRLTFTSTSTRSNILTRLIDQVTLMGASSYNPSTTQRKKDTATLAQLASITIRVLRSLSNRFRDIPAFHVNRTWYGIVISVIQSMTSQLLKKSADLANYVKNWTPLSNNALIEPKRNEAWSEMDVLKHERRGKKEPTTLITALGLVLEPITQGSGDISTFRSSILKMPTKTEDVAQRPKPINVLQTPSATQFKIVALEKL